MDSTDDQFLASIALKHGRITLEQCQECRAEAHRWATQGVRVTLREVLLARHCLEISDLAYLQYAMDYTLVAEEDVAFGDAAVEQGLATRPQVTEALARQEEAFEQRQKIPRIARLLTDAGVLEDQHVLKLSATLRKRRPAPSNLARTVEPPAALFAHAEPAPSPKAATAPVSAAPPAPAAPPPGGLASLALASAGSEQDGIATVFDLNPGRTPAPDGIGPAPTPDPQQDAIQTVLDFGTLTEKTAAVVSNHTMSFAVNPKKPEEAKDKPADPGTAKPEAPPK